MLQPKCRQPYVHGGRKVDDGDSNIETSTPKLPPRPPLPKTTVAPLSTLDRDLIKQQQLSDWYYIKTGPKSPLPPRAADNRKAIYTRITEVDAAQISSNNDKSTIANGIGAEREIAKNSMNIYSACMQRRTDRQITTKCDVRKIEEPPMQKKYNEIASDDSHYQEIGIPSVYGSIGMRRNQQQQSNDHQYSSNEPICKLNSNSNINNNNNVGAKVNGFTMWQQQQQQQQQKPQEHQYSEKQRLLLLSPPSPSLSAQKPLKTTTTTAAHPHYYVDGIQKPIEKHLSSPRQNRQIKLCEQQTDECQQTIIDANRPHRQPSAMTSPIKFTSERFDTIGSAAGSDAHSLHSNHTAERQNGMVSTSQMTINEQHQFNSKHRTPNEQTIHVAAGNGCLSESQQCLQQKAISSTISSSPSMPLANQTKVREYTFLHEFHVPLTKRMYFIRLWIIILCVVLGRRLQKTSFRQFCL